MTFWPRSHSLSRRLLAGVGLSFAGVSLATLGLNYQLMQADLERQIHKQAQSVAQSLEFSTEGLLELENRSILRRVVQNFATISGVLEIAVVDPSGMAIARSPHYTAELAYTSIYPELTETIDKAATTGIETSTTVVLDGQPVIAQVLPFSSTLFGVSQRRGVVIALLDLHQMQQAANKAFLMSTLILLVGIVTILLLMGLLLQKNVLQPLRVLNEAVAKSKETGFFPVPTTIPANEIQYLATTFDEVFQQLALQDQLKAEIAQRKQIEATLREREASERSKSQELEQTLDELKQAQAQLIQAEKISSLGQLVAGVAHEINNPVNFIHGNLNHVEDYADDLLSFIQLYQHYYPDSNADIREKAQEIDLEFLQEDFPKLIHSMKIGTDRICQIVLALRNFSRMDEAEFKDVQIHEGLDSTLLILQHRLKATPGHAEIDVVREYGDLPIVECYPGQLNQVFMNILVNAIDALEAHRDSESPATPSRITIRTAVVGADWVEIAIADNGAGMSEMTQRQIFNPFFTTKPVGKGTGMGLAISYQIVTEKHGGSLICCSTLGGGTEFVIRVPIRQTALSVA